MRTKQRRYRSGALHVELTERAPEVRLSRPSFSTCVRCAVCFPLELRQTKDGIVRDQPRCPACRGKLGAVPGARVNAKTIERQMLLDWGIKL